MRQLTLERISGQYAVCSLPHGDMIPAWAVGDFVSITRTADELSIVCSEGKVPIDVKAERGWSCLRVAGTMDFSLVGVVASLTVPIAEAGIGVFVMSTFDTDYLLIKSSDVGRAIAALEQAGHTAQ